MPQPTLKFILREILTSDNMKNIFNKKNKAGFTLVETMISVSLFIIITTVGIGALLNANLLYNKSQDVRAIIDNLNFVMEDMSRNIRTGYNYHCLSLANGNTDMPVSSNQLSEPIDCEGGGWGIAFESAYGDNTENDVPIPDIIDYEDQWVYRISDEGKIFKSTQGPYLDGQFTQLTSEEVYIDPFLSGFVVTGAEAPPGDEQQPLVTIRLVGTITYRNVVSPFSLQTTVSQRLLDL